MKTEMKAGLPKRKAKVKDKEFFLRIAQSKQRKIVLEVEDQELTAKEISERLACSVGHIYTIAKHINKYPILEKEKRNAMVLEDILRGETDREILEKYGFSKCTLKRIKQNNGLLEKNAKREQIDVRNEEILEDSKTLSEEEILEKYNIKIRTLRMLQKQHNIKRDKFKQYELACCDIRNGKQDHEILEKYGISKSTLYRLKLNDGFLIKHAKRDGLNIRNENIRKDSETLTEEEILKKYDISLKVLRGIQKQYGIKLKKNPV